MSCSDSRRVTPEPTDAAVPPTAADPEQQTWHWLRKAVVGLGLCPFAAPVVQAGRVDVVVSAARDRRAWLADLHQAISTLMAQPPEQLETRLFVHPHCLTDFLDFNDAFDDVEALLAAMALVGELQVVGFHPQHQFAGTDADDPQNLSNRSPYPTLHLLREASVEQAMSHRDDAADAIVRANTRRLNDLGFDGWARLLANP